MHPRLFSFFLYLFVHDSPTAHHSSLGVCQANAWSLPIGHSGFRSASLSSDWLSASTLPQWGSAQTASQIQTSVPSQEASSSGFSLYQHWLRGNACYTVQTGYRALLLLTVSTVNLFYLTGYFGHNDSPVAAFVSRVGRICTGRVHCVFPRAIWRWRWGPLQRIIPSSINFSVMICLDGKNI